MVSLPPLTPAALEAASSRPSGAVSPSSCIPGGHSVDGRPGPVPAPSGAGTGLVGFRETSHTQNPSEPGFSGVYTRSEFRTLQRHNRQRRLERALRAKSESVFATLPRGGRVTGALVTLTVRPGVEWLPHLMSRFMNCVRMYAVRRSVDIRYSWVAEMQARGAVHFHLIVWWSTADGRSFKLPKPDSQGWWPHGMSNIQRLKPGTAAVRYLTKYLSKGTEVPLPRGLRSYGMDRHPADALPVHRSSLPRWLAQACPSGRLDRLPFFGWRSRETGERFRARHRFVRETDGEAVWWRFAPVIERDASCLDCRFAVTFGLFKLNGPAHSFANPCGFEFCTVCT